MLLEEGNLEIVPGVHSIPVGIGSFMGFFAPNVYLVVDGEGALIDAGYGDEGSVSSRVSYVKGFDGLRLAYILVTHAHPDHIGGGAAIKGETGAEIVLHRLDEAPARGAALEPDRLVEDGDTLSLNGATLLMVHTPGHSPGHMCILLKEKGILFSGDHVLGMGTTAMRPPEGDMAQYIDSLRKLLSYDMEMICPGHGPPITAPQRKIEELIQHRLEREEQVVAALRRGRATVKELVADIYPELDSRLLQMAEGQVLAHLVKLEREGRVSPAGSEANTGYVLK